MSGAVRGLTFALIAAALVLGGSPGTVSASPVPIQQKEVLQFAGKPFWLYRTIDFRRDGRHSNVWYWRHRYLQNRHDRFQGWPRYRYWRYRTHFYPGPHWGVGRWWDDDPPVIGVRPSYNRSAHAEWCLAHYRSYDRRTNTWVGYSGRVHQCDSPYDRR